MAVNVSPVATQVLSTQPAVPGVAVTSFEERWAAWQERGAAHDRAVRRKAMIAAPVVAVVVAILYLVLLR